MRSREMLPKYLSLALFFGFLFTACSAQEIPLTKPESTLASEVLAPLETVVTSSPEETALGVEPVLGNSEIQKLSLSEIAMSHQIHMQNNPDEYLLKLNPVIANTLINRDNTNNNCGHTTLLNLYEILAKGSGNDVSRYATVSDYMNQEYIVNGSLRIIAGQFLPILETGHSSDGAFFNLADEMARKMGYSDIEYFGDPYLVHNSLSNIHSEKPVDVMLLSDSLKDGVAVLNARINGTHGYDHFLIVTKDKNGILVIRDPLNKVPPMFDQVEIKFAMVIN